MTYAKLVKVVDVGDTEVQWCQKDDLLPRKVGEDMEGNDQGAPYELFADGTLLPLVYVQQVTKQIYKPQHSSCTQSSC